MDIASLILEGFTAVAAIAAIYTIYDGKRTYKNERAHEKKQATLEAYAILQKEVFDEMFLHYNEKDIEDIAKHYIKRKSDYMKLGIYTAKIEHFAVGVIQEIYDENIVYELAHGYFDITVKNAIMPIINRKRKLSKIGDPFENTEELYLRLKKIEDDRNR